MSDKASLESLFFLVHNTRVTLQDVAHTIGGILKEAPDTHM